MQNMLDPSLKSSGQNNNSLGA